MAQRRQCRRRTSRSSVPAAAGSAAGCSSVTCYTMVAGPIMNLCGVLGVFLLAAVTCCTWHGVQAHSSHQQDLGTTNENKFHNPQLVRDAEHIKEHLKEDVGDGFDVNMSPEELEFHYFQMHDLDNNSRLDGLEILAALNHAMPLNEADFRNTDGSPMTYEGIQKKKDDQLNMFTGIIDKVLEDDDFNKDGYLTYPEYVLARRREEMSQDIAKLVENG